MKKIQIIIKTIYKPKKKPLKNFKINHIKKSKKPFFKEKKIKPLLKNE